MKAHIERLARAVAISATSLVITTVASAQSPSVVVDREVRPIDRALRPIGRIAGQVDSAYTLEDRMRYWRVPGVSIAVIENFRIVHARGYGVTEFGSGTPVDTNTLFQAGSISKPVFATGALKLVEQGKLSLDEGLQSGAFPAIPQRNRCLR